ncbi:hypothetical protein FY140_24730 (plasmid) [Agrobacterium tumefaciens]|uniref:hypothetical protein n=1 Tax=Agrobacterium tumefaciens TaxID=358 RepID=UPI0021D0FE7E|nr:hypothetical protein [Agrobacterium tumefaciens]UXT23998.1 hypothetical protein FY140_24730 [Agrobacterium tumefaciens]
MEETTRKAADSDVVATSAMLEKLVAAGRRNALLNGIEPTTLLLEPFSVSNFSNAYIDMISME